MRQIHSVEPFTDGYLLITFDTNEQKFVDIKPLMKGVLEKLQNPKFFNQVVVNHELMTVSWPGELNLDPEKLYKQGIATI